MLAAAAERAGMGAAVPACPGWTVGDLLRHTSYVHRWAAAFVAQGLTRPDGGPSEEEILRQSTGDGLVLGWFREGHAALVRTLEEASPDVECWAFLSAPSPLAFWARRQAHETAIHRVDAEQAAAGPAAPVRFEPAFAADGVDELLMGFLARNIKRGNWPGLGGDLAIQAGDGPGARADWLVAGLPGATGVSRGPGAADCSVAGPAARSLPDAVEPRSSRRAAADRRPRRPGRFRPRHADHLGLGRVPWIFAVAQRAGGLRDTP